MLIVGRAQTCQLVLDSDHVSRMHAQFWIEHDAMWVEDLGSRNGVLVNGRKILLRTRLEIGDRVVIGDRTLEVTVRSSDRNPTIPVMEPAEDLGLQALPEPGPVLRISPASATALLRDDDTKPTTLEASSPMRKFLDAASLALAGGNLHDAADAMRNFCETLDETAHLGATDRGALEGATKVMI